MNEYTNYLDGRKTANFDIKRLGIAFAIEVVEAAKRAQPSGYKWTAYDIGYVDEVETVRKELAL